MTAHTRGTFDEQAALEELERLQQAIADSRRRRGQTVDEFNAFVRSFAATPSDARPPAREEPRPAPFAPRQRSSLHSSLDEIASRIEAAARRTAPWPADMAPLEPIDLPADPPRPRPGRVPPTVVLAGVGTLVAITVAVVMLTRGTPPAPSPASAAVAGPSASSPAAAPAPAVPGRTGGMQIEITTVRPVWVRVLADGQRTIERELKANERIPVHAVKTLAIRAGDAGALRVSIDGRDQGPLGKDGVIATRTFTAGASPSSPR